VPGSRPKNALERRRYRLRTGSAPDQEAAAARRRAWTPEEDARVRAHAIPDRELAADLGRSVNAIHRRRYDLRGRA
jgi:hypothetical protein